MDPKGLCAIFPPQRLQTRWSWDPCESHCEGRGAHPSYRELLSGLYLLQSLSASEILLWCHGQAVLSFFVMWCVPTEVSSQQPQAVRGHFCAFEVTIAQATALA